MMKLLVRDMGRGFTQLMLAKGQQVLGTATVTWDDYKSALKGIFMSVEEAARECISKTLAQHLWQDAQAMVAGSDAELAKEKLLEFGWNQQKIDTYAGLLTRALVQELTKYLPEHR